MNYTGRFLAVLTLIALCTPAFSAGSPSLRGSQGCSTGCAGLARSGFRGGLSNLLMVAEYDPPAFIGADLRTAATPPGCAELTLPEQPAARLPVLRWPSLGGGPAPFYQPIPPTYLPCLLDAGTPSEQEDTLRLFRSHW